MNIYFLRHGETDENKKKTYYGNLDISLNSKGREGIKKISPRLTNIDFNRIYTSELKRTIETAEILFNDREVNIIRDGRINEINFGIFEGKSYKDIGKLYPEERDLWIENWKSYCPPAGESYEMFYSRVRAFMEHIKNMKCGNILVITHGGVMRAVYSYVLDENLDFYWKFSSKNGDLSLIKYEDDFFYIDSIEHLC